jgi:hypothetical protein
MQGICFTPTVDFAFPRPDVQAVLYSAVEALRVCAAHASHAADWFDDPASEHADDQHEYIGQIDMIELKFNARLFVSIFQEIIGGVTPSMPDRVFRSLAGYTNLRHDNIPGIEGATLALEVARLALDQAVEMSAERSDEIDAADEVIMAGRAVVLHFKSLLECSTVPFFCEEVIGAIVEGKPMPTLADLYARWHEENAAWIDAHELASSVAL